MVQVVGLLGAAPGAALLAEQALVVLGDGAHALGCVLAFALPGVNVVGRFGVLQALQELLVVGHARLVLPDAQLPIERRHGLVAFTLIFLGQGRDCALVVVA